MLIRQLILNLYVFEKEIGTELKDSFALWRRLLHNLLLTLLLYLKKSLIMLNCDCQKVASVIVFVNTESSKMELSKFLNFLKSVKFLNLFKIWVYPFYTNFNIFLVIQMLSVQNLGCAGMERLGNPPSSNSMLASLPSQRDNRLVYFI
jgi:hypothetical protein